MAHFHHCSICNHYQSISNLVIFGSFVSKIPRLQPYLLAKNGSFSSLFNLQSKSINFKFGHFWPKYQGYSLTVWQRMAPVHHFSICNQNESISSLVIFGQNTKAIALLFGQNWLIFITFQSAIKINQFQFWSCLAKIPRLQPYFLAKNGSFSSLFNLQSKSMTVKLGQFWVIFEQNTKAIALLFCQTWLIFITFQSAININQFKFWSFLAKIPRLQPYFLAKTGSVSSLFNLQSNSINFNFGLLWPKYQGYSLTFWPKMDHFHHFSICNQNQSISIQVNFGQNTKAIAVLFGHKWLLFNHFSICNQTQSISMLVIFGQNTTAIALLICQKWLIFITFQSAIKINQFQIWSFLGHL